MKVSIRTWVSIATATLIVILIVLSRKELVQAWELLGQVDLRILALFVPLLIISNYAAAEMIFSYLKQNKLMTKIKPLSQLRISLEMNFANHALPSGGVSGASYIAWRLNKLGVPMSKTTIALAVRFIVGFGAFLSLLAVAIIFVTIDGAINRWIILVSAGIATLMIGASAAAIYFIHGEDRIQVAAIWITKAADFLTHKVTRGRRISKVKSQRIETYLLRVREDYIVLMQNKQNLLKPFIWGIVFTLAEVAMFWVAFWALGTQVNPAPILIAYGVATIAGFVVLTPGGSGAYEALMVGFLAVAGIAQDIAIAGIVLTRVIILMFVLSVGYVLYQLALIKYGKNDRTDF